MRVVETPEEIRVEAEAYTLTILPGRPVARLSSPDGTEWARLALVAAIDTAQGLDDTAAVSVGTARREGQTWRLEVEAIGARWTRKVVELSGDERTLRLRARVEGAGDVTDVRLLAGDYSGDRHIGTGNLLSSHSFATVFNPEPSDPAVVCRPATVPAQIDVTGGGRGPASGHWFFTPPPFAFGFSRMPFAPDTAPAGYPGGPWLTIGLEAPLAAQTFTAFRYEPDERAFGLSLRYEGQTHIEGEFETPTIVIGFDAADPYEGIARYAGELRRLGLAPAPARPAGATPRWWREPIFCGWGAQMRLGYRTGTPPQAAATQANYDRWLEHLAAHDIVPGTIVIDDKWQAQYGTCEPDPERWPDLAGWIARRHAAGQRVLLWWKAWDPEGLPAELCVRNAAGLAIATDPTNPAYERALRAVVRRLLGPAPGLDAAGHAAGHDAARVNAARVNAARVNAAGHDAARLNAAARVNAARLNAAALDADGLKIDFTSFVPTGPGLRRHGTAWGVSMLHRLLEIVADEARLAKPDALVISHAPNAAFAGVTDMIRLNDMDRFDEPDDPTAIVPQMRHRWRVTRAACPDLLIDTDDWGPPSRQVWREYQELKPEIGVPALYYADGLDRSGEDFDETDYALIRRVWAKARALEEPDRD